MAFSDSRTGAGPTLRFPTRLSAMWRQATLSLSLGAAVAQLWRWAEGREFAWPSTLLMMAIAACMVLATFLLMPPQANRRHIWLYTRWGWRQRLPWTELRAVRLTRWYLAPALRVQTAGHGTHWLPRDTVRLPQLHALALQQLGPQHPFVQALETPLYRL